MPSSACVFQAGNRATIECSLRIVSFSLYTPILTPQHPQLVYHACSLDYYSCCRLNRFPCPEVSSNWPLCVDVPLNTQSINICVDLFVMWCRLTPFNSFKALNFLLTLHYILIQCSHLLLSLFIERFLVSQSAYCIGIPLIWFFRYWPSFNIVSSRTHLVIICPNFNHANFSFIWLACKCLYMNRYVH